MRTRLARGHNAPEARRRLAVALYGEVPPTGPTGPEKAIYGLHNIERYRLPVEIEGRVFVWVHQPRCTVCNSPWADDLDRAVQHADRLLSYRALARVLQIPRPQRPKARDFGWTALAKLYPEAGLSPDAIRRHFIRGHSPVLQAQDWIDEVRRPELLAKLLGSNSTWESSSNV